MTLARLQGIGYTTPVTITNTIRERMNSSGITRAEIARRTGIAESVLSRFHRGITMLDGAHIDTLADFLGLGLQEVRTPPIPPAESRNADAGGRDMKGASPSPKARARGKNSKATTKTTKAGTARKGNE
jgi:transcriptional regulator with XRE-family HTH domain